MARQRKKASLALAPASSPDRALTVTEVSRLIKQLIEDGVGHVWIEGEVSNLRMPRSGHAYFVLKDADAALNAVCFRSALDSLGLTLRDGVKVEVYGRATAYTPRSEYQVIVMRAREAGLGELMRRLMQLRDKLKAEGLFDLERKRALPRLPRTIGVVTSATGAALRDILHVLSRRASGLTILVSPCAVQGAAAAPEIVRAIRRLEREGSADVVIVARGGGSIEDLWSFNDERVVRAIVACKIPTICGVGHETDTTLADLAADVRAPTPSAAAEMVTQHYEDLARAVKHLHSVLNRSMLQRLRERRDALRVCIGSWSLRRPAELLAASAQRVDDFSQRLDRAMADRLGIASQRVREARMRLASRRPDALWLPRIREARGARRQLEGRLAAASRNRLARARLSVRAAGQRLESLAPANVLKRGYSFITDMSGRTIITRPGQPKMGQKLRVHSAGGEWRATPLPAEDELFDSLSEK